MIILRVGGGEKTVDAVRFFAKKNFGKRRKGERRYEGWRGVRVSLVWAKLGLSRSAGQIKTAITRRMVR